MATLPPEVLARARAQERQEDQRREINRAMIAAARERDEYVSRGSAGRPTPELEAHQRLRDLLRDHQNPALSVLREQALAWLAEDQATGARAQATDRKRAKPQGGSPRARRHPLEYVPDCPWRVTLTQARLLDLRCQGAATREIAAIETISRGAVQTALKRLSATLDAPSQPQARALWRNWCVASGRTVDPALVRSVELLRGRPPLTTDAGRSALRAGQADRLRHAQDYRQKVGDPVDVLTTLLPLSEQEVPHAG